MNIFIMINLNAHGFVFCNSKALDFCPSKQQTAAPATIKFPFQAQFGDGCAFFVVFFLVFVGRNILVRNVRYANQDVSQSETSCQFERRQMKISNAKERTQKRCNRWEIECHFVCCRNRSGSFHPTKNTLFGKYAHR